MVLEITLEDGFLLKHAVISLGTFSQDACVVIRWSPVELGFFTRDVNGRYVNIRMEASGFEVFSSTEDFFSAELNLSELRNVFLNIINGVLRVTVKFVPKQSIIVPPTSAALMLVEIVHVHRRDQRSNMEPTGGNEVYYRQAMEIQCKYVDDLLEEPTLLAPAPSIRLPSWRFWNVILTLGNNVGSVRAILSRIQCTFRDSGSSITFNLTDRDVVINNMSRHGAVEFTLVTEFIRTYTWASLSCSSVTIIQRGNGSEVLFQLSDLGHISFTVM